jgi:hypothetical protein
VKAGAKADAKAGTKAGASAWRGLMPWALLGAAVVAVVASVGLPSRAPSELPPARETPSSPSPSPSPSSARGTASALEGGAGADEMTPAERRDFHISLGHEQCEEGMKKFNALEGRAPTDPAVLTRLSVCLRIGNLAWYKCMLRAGGAEDAHVCNRRFLSLDNPP